MTLSDILLSGKRKIFTSIRFVLDLNNTIQKKKNYIEKYNLVINYNVNSKTGFLKINVSKL